MSTLWRKAIKDLRGERFRSASIIVALALGIASFFAVLSSYAVLTRALNDGYRATNPPSATITVDQLDDEVLRTVSSIPGLEEIEARRTVHGRIKSGPAQWQNLMLFVRGEFETSRIGKLGLENGSWPSKADVIAIERDALQVAQVSVGDTVSVLPQDGTERRLRVCGSIHDVGQAQARMENIVYGYVTPDTLAALGEQPHFDELAIRVAEHPLDAAHISQIAGAVKETIEANGHHVVRVDVPEPGQHPHAKIMGLLLLTISLFGLFILFLSGAIVFNVLTALLTAQVRQIGVMKALGGTRFQIARIYLVEAGLLGVAAIVLALPIGLLGGRWHSRWLAGFLNFDIASHAVPLWIYALVAAIGVVVPIVAAVIPVWLGTRVPVREAMMPTRSLAHGTSIVDRALAKVSGPSRVLSMAIRNAGRNRLRVGLTLVTLAAGGVFCMAALNLRQSMIGSLDRLFETRRADLTVTLASDYPVDAVERAILAIPGVTAAEGWIVADGKISSTSERGGERLAADGDPFRVIAVPAESRLVGFDLSKGNSLDASVGGMIVNTALYERLGSAAVGENVPIRIDGKDALLRLAGVTREPFTPPACYILRDFFEQSPKAVTANSLRIAFENSNPAAIGALRGDIDVTLSREGFRALQTSTNAESRYVFDQHMLMIYVFLIVVSCIVGVVGALGLVTTVSLNVTERRREMGVLRAIGATPARVILMVLAEGVIVGLLGWMVATMTAWPLSKLVGDLLLGLMFRTAAEIPVVIEPLGVIIWLVVSVVGSALASLWPAWQASRMSVREALTYE